MYNIYLRHAYPNELYHHGILGQKWGVRRYQNKDGSLTPAGKKRYLNNDGTLTKKGKKFIAKNDANKSVLKKAGYKGTPSEQSEQALKNAGFNTKSSDDGNVKWYEKEIKGKNGNIRVTTLTAKNDKIPLTDDDIKIATDSVNKYGASCKKKLLAEFEDNVKRGYWGNDNSVKLGNIDYMHFTKWSDDDISCEIMAPVLSKKGNDWFGAYKVFLNPKTGEIDEYVSYDD